MKRDNDSRNQAKAQLRSIGELVAQHRAAVKSEDDDAIEEAESTIDADALSCEFRSGWVVANDTRSFDGAAAEIRVVLCTGGPHVEIRAELTDGSADRGTCELWFRGWGECFKALKLGDHDRGIIAHYLSALTRDYAPTFEVVS